MSTNRLVFGSSVGLVLAGFWVWISYGVPPESLAHGPAAAGAHAAVTVMDPRDIGDGAVSVALARDGENAPPSAVSVAEVEYERTYGATAPLPLTSFFLDESADVQARADALLAQRADFDNHYAALLDLMRYCNNLDSQMRGTSASLTDRRLLQFEAALLACAEMEGDADPFFELERRAEAGNLAMRLIYLDQLQIAAERGIVDPMRDTRSFALRKERGMDWLRDLEASGSGLAAYRLALEYAYATLVDEDRVLVIYYAQRALDRGITGMWQPDTLASFEAALDDPDRIRLDRLLARGGH